MFNKTKGELAKEARKVATRIYEDLGYVGDIDEVMNFETFLSGFIAGYTNAVEEFAIEINELKEGGNK